MAVFKAGGGLGLIPGMDRISSVIQVSGNWQELKGWSGGTWPIRPEMVTDVGKYFVNTGRLAAIAWAWATEYDGSPDLYKIHVAVLHERWKRYCDAGLRYLLDNAKDFADNHGKGRVYSGNPEYIFGSAIGCAIGAWRCMPDGNGYRLLTPGLHGDDIRGYGYGRENLGCVMDPPSMAAYANGQACFYTIYDRFIKPTLDRTMQRQRYFLRHSLVAAYVRTSFDAFKDPRLKTALIEARKIMLDHPDRMLVQLDDVADDEPGISPGKTWKQELVASGVKKKPPFLGGGGRLAGPPPGTLVPTDDPPPKMPVYEGPMAWGDVPVDGPSPWRYVGYAAGGLAIAGGGYALARWLRNRAG